MSKTTYIAHATRKDGKEISFNMPYEDESRAVTRLIDIVVDELGNGDGNLKTHLPEIAAILYSGERYSYADCEFWVETKESNEKERSFVWVLSYKVGEEKSVKVFSDWANAIICVGTIVDLSGGVFSNNDCQTLVEKNHLSKSGIEIDLSMQEVI